MQISYLNGKFWIKDSNCSVELIRYLTRLCRGFFNEDSLHLYSRWSRPQT